MRRLAILVFAAALAALPAQASVCEASPGKKTAPPRWQLDHYVHDASLDRDWKVMVDCNHPDAPPKMEIAPEEVGKIRRATIPGKLDVENAPRHQAAPPLRIRAGADVEVSNAPGAPARILLAGTAMQTGVPGQKIRVRLSASGRFITGTVRGPHSVELAAGAKPFWERP